MSAETQRRYKARHPDRVKDADARYSDTERGRETRRRANRLWKTRNHERVLAHGRVINKVRRAITRGDLVRLACRCGNTNVQAHHHNGYGPGHELDVVWLCSKHHAEEHR